MEENTRVFPQKRTVVAALMLCVSAVLFCCLLAPPLGGLQANAVSTEVPVEVDRDGSAATLPGATVGIEHFARMNKGTARLVGEQDFGYRYQMVGPQAFALLVLSESQALVYLDADAARQLNFDPTMDADRDSFLRLITALDAVAPNGGRPISGLNLSYQFTSERQIARGDFLYRFALPGDDGNYYVGVTANKAGEQSAAEKDAVLAAELGEGDISDPAAAFDPSDGALFCLTGDLANPGNIHLTELPQGLDAFLAFLSSIDMRPFWVSLKTAGVAMIFIFVLGILAARLSLRIGPRLQGVLDSLFTIPMVLPPTVCGFLLLVLLGNSTPVGRWLVAHGVELVFSWPSAVIAAAVVGFPLMYRTVRGAFESQDGNLFDAARTLGWSEQRIFFRLMLPLAWPSIAAGTVLAFARAMGEFGATLFVAGNYPGITQTMPIAIYFQWMGGHSDVATFWVIVTVILSFLVILFINWYAAYLQSYRRMSKSERQMHKNAARAARRQAARGGRL